MRITGLASGLDVETMVKTMMKAENVKLDRLKQNRQILQWRQDNYRDILGDVNIFKSNYFDILKPENYMLSSKTYDGFDVTSNDSTSNTTSKYVSATASTGATVGTYNVDVVQMAKAASISSSLATGKNASSKLSDLGVTVPASLVLKYSNDGTNILTKTINISDGNKTIKDVLNQINSETNNAVSAKYSELTNSITFQTASTGANTSISFESGSSSTLLSALGLSGFTESSGITTSAVVGTGAQNAKVSITPPGASSATTVEKTNNVFTIDSITYNILGLPSGESTVSADITVAANPQETFDKIKGFIDKYNEMIDKINTELTEKKQYSYKPLTDEEREAMTEDEVKLWEDKAKQGLLRNDSNLQGMLTAMRKAFYDSVKDSGVTLSDIGLSTSPDYTTRGKIIINETKLKNAIRNNGEQVKKLFINESSTSYNVDHKDPDAANGKYYSARYEENGIFQRMNDILKDYTRTNRDSNNKKGILLEIAGIKGDASEYENSITKQLRDDYDKRIDALQDILDAKENRYYLQFSKLETAMQQLNSQSSWLAQQFGTSGS
jgi:flagellar hook-associated protein 2